MLEQSQLRAPCAEVSLSPQQKKESEHTVAALLIHARWYASVLYSTLRWRVTRDVPTAATDEWSIFVNPDDFYARPLAHRVFILAHEILHVVLMHCSLSLKWRRQGYVLTKGGRKLPYFPRLMNIAQDFVINAIQHKTGVGEMPPDACYDPQISPKGMESIVDIYEQLCDKYGIDENTRIIKVGLRIPTAGKGMQDVGDVVLDVMEPGEGSSDLVEQSEAAGKGGAEERADQIKLAVARATTACKQMGSMPAGLLEIISELLEPQIEWPDHLATLCMRRVGTGGYDYSSVDRRLVLRNIGGPRQSDFGCGPIVVVGDSSGSIPKALLDRFAAETAGVLEQLKPSRVYFMWCDAAIGRIDELETVDDLMDSIRRGVSGGGGTSFKPPFEWLYENQVVPDLLIYLTDGYGTWPDEPQFPVIWGMTTDVKPPFGDIVHVPLDTK